jgi:hypothetical protein
MASTRITFPLTISTPSWAFSPMEDEMQFQKISRRKALTGAGVEAEEMNGSALRWPYSVMQHGPSISVYSCITLTQPFPCVGCAYG